MNTKGLMEVDYGIGKSKGGKIMSKDNFWEPRGFKGWNKKKAERWAHQEGKSGFPNWMESFSPVDMFGNPTVFADRRNSSEFEEK